MKSKRIKKYTLIILVGFIINFIFFSTIMVSDFLKLPSDQWSKEIEIEQFDFPSSTYISNQYQIYDSVALDDGFLLSFIDQNEIRLQKLDNNFSVLSETSMPFVPDSDIRSIHIVNDTHDHYQLVVYSIKNKSLSYYPFDINDFAIQSLSHTIENINYYTFIDHVSYYISDNILYLYNQENTAIYQKVETEILSSCEDDAFDYLFTVERENSKRVLMVYKVNKLTEKVEKYTLSQMPSDNAISLQNLEILMDQNQFVIVTVLRNSKTQYNLATLSYYETDDYALIDSFDLNFEDYMPNPSLFKSGEQLNISFLNPVQLGRIDVSRKYSKYPNVVIGHINTDGIDTIKQLTKTENTKIRPTYYENAQQNTLIWMQYDGEHYVIYGASDNPLHLTQSKKYNFSDIFGVLMNALTTYFPALYASMVLMFSVIVPMVIIYGALSFFKITWVEHHGNTILWFMVGAHTLIKFYSFIPTIHKTLDLMTGLPFIYSTFWGQLFYMFLLSGLSLISLMLYHKEHHNQGAFIQYLRFSFLDCLLLITAFYPLYFV